MRHRTGLHNRFRSGGGSSYQTKNKARGADKYGQQQSGKITDTIAGRSITYKVGYVKP